MNYLRYFTSYFSSEKTNYDVKECENKLDKFDKLDEEISNSLNKQMMYNLNKDNNTTTNTNLNKDKDNNKINKINFVRKNSLLELDLDINLD